MKTGIMLCLAVVTLGMGFRATAQCQSGDCENGYGIKKINEGKYSGHFKDGKMDGEGKFEWGQGQYFEGDFVADKMAWGIGTLVNPDGSKFYGEVSRNAQTTENGIFYLSNGSVDKTKGLGKTSEVHPELTKGCLAGQCKEGFGIMVYDDGSKYEGFFVKGVRNGKGKYFWPSGEKYYGYWSNGVIQGYGVTTSPDGSKYCGYYNNGKMTGEGTYYFADGTINKTKGLGLVDKEFEENLKTALNDAEYDFYHGRGEAMTNYVCNDKTATAFKCTFSLKDAINTRIEKSASGKYRVVAEYYSGNDEKMATGQYNIMLEKLKFTLKSYASSEITPGAGQVKNTRLYDKNNFSETYPTINLRLDKTGNNYIVLIELNKERF